MVKNLKKINPKLIEPLMDALVLVKDEKRIEYLDTLFTEVEHATETAEDYAKLQNVEFKTALKQVKVTREISSFCKKDC